MLEAVKNRGLDAEHVQAAWRVLGRTVPSERIKLAFVSGSLVAGLGHGFSDVDLYLAVSDGESMEQRGSREGRFIVQINPITAEGLHLIAKTCAGYTATPRDRWQLGLRDDELRLALRYAIGRTLVNNMEGALPDADDACETIRRVRISRSAFAVSRSAEDALGALQVGDALTALNAAQIAVTDGAEAALAATGDLYVGRGFLLRRLLRSDALADVADDIWEGLRLPTRSTEFEDAASMVISRLRLAVHLVTSAALDGWDSLATEFRRFPKSWACGGPISSPWTVPVRFSDSWGFAAPDAGFRTTEGMVRLFREIDGRTLAEVQLGFAEDPVFAGTSREILDSAVAKLFDKKAVTENGGEY